MDFTLLPLLTPVVWRRGDKELHGVIIYIDDYEMPVRVKFEDGSERHFYLDGKYISGEEPTLHLLEPQKQEPTAQSADASVWVQFMCAAMGGSESISAAAVIADAALEKYKKRFQ